MKDDLDLIGRCKPVPAFSVNGEGFDAALDRFARVKALAPRPIQTIPLTGYAAHAGECEKKPWDYEVAVCVPTVNAADRLRLIVQLLRLQTVRPYILIVDCGSSPEQFRNVEKLRAQDVEVHALRMNGVCNASEIVSMAMDVSLSLCQSRFLFCTHDDCFLKSQVALQYFRDLCSVTKVCGHQLTPRRHEDWEGMIGHTALMLDMQFILDKGLTWNMRRCARRFGLSRTAGTKQRPNFPDTETGMNYLLRAIGIQPFLTGTEENHSRNQDGFIDHCRSTASAALYNPQYAVTNSKPWLADAMKRARKRIREWTDEPIGEVPPLFEHMPKPVQRLPKFNLEPGGKRL